MSASVDSDYNAYNDFFVVIVRCHVVIAAMEYLAMKGTSDNPVHHQLKDDLWLQSMEERASILYSVASEIVLMYVDVRFAK